MKTFERGRVMGALLSIEMIGSAWFNQRCSETFAKINLKYTFGKLLECTV